jgi:AcrR family transcriptional regulator
MPVPTLSRDELLGRLRDTFCRYGYEGASMVRIARASGLGKASLYYYFPEGKKQMAAAVLETIAAWFETNIFHPLEQMHPPRQRIVCMLDNLNRYYRSGQQACLPGLFALAEERELFGDPIHRFFIRWVAALSQTLIDSGLARDTAQRRAHDAVERIQGTVVLGRALADSRVFPAMAAELPDQLLAGSDRSTLWTTRAPRYPAQTVNLTGRSRTA